MTKEIENSWPIDEVLDEMFIDEEEMTEEERKKKEEEFEEYIQNK